MTLRFPHLLLIGTSLVALGSGAVRAANADCVGAHDCKPKLVAQRLSDLTVENVEDGSNTEKTVAQNTKRPMFSISVDGEHVAGTKIPKDKQRKTDLALEAVDIQVKFDGLDVKPVLNVSTFPPRQAYQGGEQIDFFASSNYPAWIAKSEVRIFKLGDEGKADPIAIVPMSEQRAASWNMPQHGPIVLSYVLRVTDSEGRFDETRPLPLTRTSKKMAFHETSSELWHPATAKTARPSGTSQFTVGPLRYSDVTFPKVTL